MAPDGVKETSAAGVLYDEEDITFWILGLGIIMFHFLGFQDLDVSGLHVSPGTVQPS